MIEVEIGDSFSVDGFIAGDEDRCFRAIGVGDG